MQLLVFLLAYPLLWLISRLPFRLLYALSDAIFFLVYFVLKYRKKVVHSNLKLVFPDKTPDEILRIQKQFYRHMIDMFMEMIKTMGISEKALQKRFVFKNLEVLHQLESQSKSIMLMYPHYASWEWSIALGGHIKSKGYGIYQPIQNVYFDKLVRDIREKFGATLIATRATKDVVFRNRRNNQLSIYGILSDQSPMIKRTQYWTDFMGITVPVHTGAELLCKSLNLPAVYLKVEKLRRGHYQGTFRVLAENPKSMGDHQITKAFLNEVEMAIREAPEYYFWTHKRWKHRDKVPTKYQNGPKTDN